MYLITRIIFVLLLPIPCVAAIYDPILDQAKPNSITIIGLIGLFLATNFIWYWQGFKDGRREGYARGRNLSRQGFWQE